MTVLKFKIMIDLLYVIVAILIIAWILGVVAFHATGIIHILLVLAVITLLLRLNQIR